MWCIIVKTKYPHKKPQGIQTQLLLKRMTASVQNEYQANNFFIYLFTFEMINILLCQLFIYKINVATDQADHEISGLDHAYRTF